jgi:hypothetical protein
VRITKYTIGEFSSYPITDEFSFPRKIKRTIPKLTPKCKEKILLFQKNPKFLINTLSQRKMALLPHQKQVAFSNYCALLVPLTGLIRGQTPKLLTPA